MSEESRLADPAMRERSDRIYTGGMAEDYSHRDLCDDFVMLQDDNARLRELCGDMHRHLLNRNTLLELLHFRLTDEERAAIADIEDRMRFLGIEGD